MKTSRTSPAVLFSLAIEARDYRAQLQGLVTDSSNALVPGVTVALRNNQTGVERNRASDASGRYFFDFVEPGTYTLTIEITGFSRYSQKTVLMQVRGDVTVNATLKLGAMAETVTLTKTVAQVQFNSTTLELTVTRSMLNGIPSGWSASPVFNLTSGSFLRFGQAIVEGDPCLDNPTRARCFDTPVFRKPCPTHRA